MTGTITRIISFCMMICVTFTVCLLTTGRVSAQYGATRSSWFPQNNPSTLSPWLEMQRVSTSELDSYNQYVKPRLEMERLIMAQQREMNRQQDIQKTMQREISQTRSFRQSPPMNAPMPTQATPTGKGATYGNYLHYYPQKK